MPSKKQDNGPKLPRPKPAAKRGAKKDVQPPAAAPKDKMDVDSDSSEAVSSDSELEQPRESAKQDSAQAFATLFNDSMHPELSTLLRDLPGPHGDTIRDEYNSESGGPALETMFLINFYGKKIQSNAGAAASSSVPSSFTNVTFAISPMQVYGCPRTVYGARADDAGGEGCLPYLTAFWKEHQNARDKIAKAAFNFDGGDADAMDVDDEPNITVPAADDYSKEHIHMVVLEGKMLFEHKGDVKKALIERVNDVLRVPPAEEAHYASSTLAFGWNADSAKSTQALFPKIKKWTIEQDKQNAELTNNAVRWLLDLDGMRSFITDESLLTKLNLITDLSQRVATEVPPPPSVFGAGGAAQGAEQSTHARSALILFRAWVRWAKSEQKQPKVKARRPSQAQQIPRDQVPGVKKAAEAGDMSTLKSILEHLQKTSADQQIKLESQRVEHQKQLIAALQQNKTEQGPTSDFSRNRISDADWVASENITADSALEVFLGGSTLNSDVRSAFESLFRQQDIEVIRAFHINKLTLRNVHNCDKKAVHTPRVFPSTATGALTSFIDAVANQQTANLFANFRSDLIICDAALLAAKAQKWKATRQVTRNDIITVVRDLHLTTDRKELRDNDDCEKKSAVVIEVLLAASPGWACHISNDNEKSRLAMRLRTQFRPHTEKSNAGQCAVIIKKVWEKLPGSISSNNDLLAAFANIGEWLSLAEPPTFTINKGTVLKNFGNTGRT